MTETFCTESNFANNSLPLLDSPRTGRVLAASASPINIAKSIPVWLANSRAADSPTGTKIVSAPTFRLFTVNGTETQKGDLTELIWNVPEIIWQLSQQVKLAAGDIIMTGTPAGVSQLQPGDKLECGVDGVGTLKVNIGKPE